MCPFVGQVAMVYLITSKLPLGCFCVHSMGALLWPSIKPTASLQVLGDRGKLGIRI